MGCINTKPKNVDRTESPTRWQRLCSRLRKRHKVGPSNNKETEGSPVAVSGMKIVPLSLFETIGNLATTEEIKGSPRGVPVDQGTPMINIARKAEDIIMEQLKEEGIVPRKARGGVAFEIKDNIYKRSKPEMIANADMPQPIPGVPQYTKEESILMSQIAAGEGIINHRPRILPPLVNGYTAEERDIMAEIIKNEDLLAKGKMARISTERRELAKERRMRKERQARKG